MGKRGERLDYLDGLRGWAALSVVIFHSTWEMFGRTLKSLQTTWPGPLNDGHFAVSIFFVLSGVVLTACTTGTNGHGRLQRMAAGRYFRLTIPILGASFIGYLMMSGGLLFNRNIKAILPDPWVWQMMSEQIPSIYSWIKYSLYGVYRWGGVTGYNPFLWTMPIELYGSFLLFGTTAIFGEKRVVRIGAFFVGLTVAQLFAPIYALFFCGALLCELAPIIRKQLGKRANLVGALLVGAAFLNSVFFRGQQETIAATAIVLGVLISPLLQSSLRAGSSQWLGRVSFPLYLTHGYILFGPACWAVMKLQTLGFDLPSSAAAVSPLSVLASLALARVFAPVETAAIYIARVTGSFLSSPRLPAFFVRWEAVMTIGQHQSEESFHTPLAARSAGDDLPSVIVQSSR